MSLLIRKIAQAKWRKTDIINNEDICADAITGCLRTNNNTLSLWKIDSMDKVDDAVLAIISSQSKLDTIDIIWLEENALEQNNLNIENTPGNTCIERLKNTHIDITSVTYKSLGQIAELIRYCFKMNAIRRYTVQQLKSILRQAINHGQLNLTDLHQELQLILQSPN